MKGKHEEGDGGRWSTAITPVLLAQTTHEQGQNLKRKRERGDRESQQPAIPISAGIKLQAFFPRMASEKTIAK